MDPVADEVPVAVVELSSDAPEIKKRLQDRVIQDLGKEFALADILALSDLGLSDFPLGNTGKIHKRNLAQLVKVYKDKAKSSAEPQSTASTLRGIWSRVLGVKEQEVELHASVLAFADSITILRFCHEVQVSLGLSLSVKDVMANETIHKQAAMLSNAVTQSTSKTDSRLSPMTSLPAKDEVLWETFGFQAALLPAITFAVLQAVNLGWDDVEGLLPIPDISCIVPVTGGHKVRISNGVSTCPEEPKAKSDTLWRQHFHSRNIRSCGHFGPLCQILPYPK